MLQKYHPNPLSHFLALHNSQATHNHVVDAHTLATTIANSHSQFHQQQLHQQQQQQQQQQHHQHQHQQQHQTAAALLAANHQHNAHIQLAAAAVASQHLNSHNSPSHHIHSPTQPTATTHPHNNAPSNPNHHHHQQQQHIIQRHHHHTSHTQQLIEAAAAVNTTLDAGKSFTIAAILGLQKSAMENSCKEYTNNVINLSLNGGSNSNSNTSHHNDGNGNITGQHLLLQNLSSTEQRNKDEQLHHQPQQHHQTHHQQQHPQHHSNQRDSLSHNNNNRDVTNLNVNKSNICNSFPTTTPNIITSSAASVTISHPNTVNSFNCDNVGVGSATATAAAATVLMNRYLPSAMVNVTGAVVATPSIASFAASPVMAHQQHSRANSFVAAAAAAAAAGAPSALQSLQQLHQQHAAHQTSLSFQREKLKSENNSKKSSLKNKRVRTIFTPEQLERLEAEFERQQYMVGPERLYLAHTLQLTEAQVKVWFQNRRIKWRKHHLEMTQQRLALLRQTQIAPGGSVEQTPVKVDGTDDEDCDNIKREELRDLNDSRQDTESELSVCNDSMDADAESIIDDDEET